MGGGLMQLVAYGAQDIYLTGNPQITFFKVVYRRHTNFSMESIRQTFSGEAGFGNDVVSTISRNGDLVYRMYLEHEADLIGPTPLEGGDANGSNVIGIACDYGSHLMESCELEIGGQRIDKHYGHWHSVYSQLTEFNPGADSFGGQIGGGDASAPLTKGTLFQKMSGNGQSFETKEIADDDAESSEMGGWTATSASLSTNSNVIGKFWIPLYFWFCRNPGLALPLIALQYHEVKVKITFETLKNLTSCDPNNNFTNAQVQPAVNNGSTFDLWCDYIYLDTDERRRFAQVSHEYLIEQVQFESKEGGTMDLYFNHPVKEIIWAGARDTSDHVNAPDLFAREPINNVDTTTYKLKLNGHDRFKARNYKYFTRAQIWQHHTGYGCSQETSRGDTIGVYSFALKPEEHQPSGTCNFSRIDNAQLVQSPSPAIPLNVYAVNYNVLRIMSGMGGLAYSN